jgi:hypothetical protein
VSGMAVVVLCGVLAGIAGYYFAPRDDSGRALRDPLLIPPGQLSLGDVYDTASLRVSLSVLNTSDETVSVSDISRSCTCLSIRPDAFSLKPGESLPLSVTLDLSQYGKDSSVTPFSLELVPSVHPAHDSSYSVPQRPWVVTGNVHRLVALNTNPLQLSTLYNFTSKSYAPAPISVTVQRVAGVAPTLAAHSSSPGVRADVVRDGSCKDGTCDTYTVNLSPVGHTLRHKSVEATVELAVRSAASEVLYTKPVRVSMACLTPIRCLPDELQFGIIRSNVECYKDVTVCFPDAASGYELQSVVPDDEALSVRIASTSVAADNRSMSCRMGLRTNKQGLVDSNAVIKIRNTVTGDVYLAPVCLSFYSRVSQ